MDIIRIAKGITKLIFNSDYRFDFLANKGRYNSMPDEEYLRKLFKAKLGRELNLENPKSFNEKLQWLKLYDRNPLYVITSDKYAAREYVKNKIGEEHLVPLLGVWDRPEDIDFEKLPKQFVLKCNHNSGLGMCICTDKSKLDFEKIKSKLCDGLNEDYYIRCREWQYRDIKRKVICEKFMKDEKTESLLNYKIYCFNGEPKVFHMSSDIGADSASLSFLDTEWNPLPFCRTDYPPFKVLPEKPENIDELLQTARTLAQDFPFVRVDLYVVNGQVYFSELTLDPCGGFSPFSPVEWDYKLGDWLKLPETKREDE